MSNEIQQESMSLQESVLPPDPILVHRIDDEPIMLDPDQIIFTDRSRIKDGLCPRKRFYAYDYGGTGYVFPYQNENLTIGGGIHETMDLLLQGGDFTHAIEAGLDYIEQNIWYPDFFIHEQIEALRSDAYHLVWGFGLAFDNYWLPKLLEAYEIVNVEEEINWLMARDDIDGKYLVCMSRPDGTLRSRESGALWHMSNKTCETFTSWQRNDIRTDIQRYLESMAIWAKYGEQPQGTVYNYFIKGSKYFDKDLNMERFGSGLIHPYINRKAVTTVPTDPQHLSWKYSWQTIGSDHRAKTSKLGSTWERVTIYNDLPYAEYLDWLARGEIQHSEDAFKESVLGMIAEPNSWDQIGVWFRGITAMELGRHYVMEDHDLGNPEVLDVAARVEPSRCFSYNKPCPYLQICEGAMTMEEMIENGRLVERGPNHRVEMMAPQLRRRGGSFHAG